ncbi:hypothetical protein [Rhodococcus opacus]|uniref:hypothetical protein n=1 Tax=Rhodococcus opacus TaxID=37919 RepID=UPI0024769205|nr:hypothetical protein [Rhodococcus opacus]MDH6292013.1 hypothetical protein [Rhodococcus opacus]
MVWVALLPLMLLAVSLLGAFVEDNRGSWVGDVLTMWNLVGIFGSMVFVPLVAVSLIGAGLLRWRFRIGRWLSTLGSSVMLLVATALSLGAIASLIAPPEHRDPNSWAGPLSILGTALFVVPYVVMTTANAYVLIRLWKRP